MKTNTIYHRSCEDLSGIDDDSVALTVTSPPYWNAVDYDRHTEDPDQWYRTRAYAQGYTQYHEYIEWIAKVFGGILHKTKPGGYAAIVIGTVILDKKHHPAPFDIVAALTKTGWQFHQDIVWHKVTGGVKRAGVAIQHPYPGYFYPNIMMEYILLFRKEGPPIFKERSPEEKQKAEFSTQKLFTTEIANNIWHIAPVPPRQIDHPCPFPEEIPHRLIQLYSYPGDIILDPFTGCGQTPKVAHHLGRKYIGIETEERYVEMARKRVKEKLQIREKQLLAVFERIDKDAERTGIKRKGAKTRHG